MAVSRARRLRNNPTEAERRLWSVLRQRQVSGAKFRRQAPFGPYVADFVCFSARVIVEVDGGQHATRTEDDARRDVWFAARGYRTLRFWNHEIFDNLEGVVATIASALEPSPHPGPPPQGGRET